MRRTWPNALGMLLLAVGVSFLAGCPRPPEPINPQPRSEVTMSAQRLAQDLGLVVVERNSHRVTLRNANNVVMLYPEPYGQVYVNARRIVQRSGIFYDRREVYLPANLEPQIQQAMRANSWNPQGPPIVFRPTDRTRPPIVPVDHGRVLIDPGHGGHDPGTHSAAGVTEKSVVLDVGLKLARDLQLSRVDVNMTRNNDTFVDLDERAEMSNRRKVDLFVAVHADSAPRSSANGFTVYVSKNASVRSHTAAAAINRSLSAAGFNSNGIRGANYRVLVKNDRPAVLVELGYLSNPTEAARLNDAGERTVYAQAIADGIVRYLKSMP